jgi:hypothetical protein
MTPFWGLRGDVRIPRLGLLEWGLRGVKDFSWRIRGQFPEQTEPHMGRTGDLHARHSQNSKWFRMVEARERGEGTNAEATKRDK